MKDTGNGAFPHPDPADMADDNRTVEEKVDEAIENEEPMIEMAAQIMYGVSIFMLDNGEVTVEMTENPQLAKILMLLHSAVSNMEADITARKVLAYQAHSAQQQPRIITPRMV